ncbi:FAD-dependent oxidoreductase [Flavobacterium sp. JP2137]|uniref:FAD-dependent oxidoreductase n=1 Tax=Flavobacterium sp. JP2137 TaxID=3414510 RepID=UPI003D2FFEB9
MYDALIIGGGAAGISCALVLGSAHAKPFMNGKKIALIAHQKASMLQDAVFYNAYGVPAGKLGAELLQETKEQLRTHYPEIEQIEGEKVQSVLRQGAGFVVQTNKNTYESLLVVVAVNSSSSFQIEGLMEFTQPHGKSLPQKNRIQLKNDDQLVATNLYVAGTLAGHRSQLSIAAGSGAAVATDILTLWNNGTETHSHDSIR